MDGIFLLALIGFAALSAGFVALCARLRGGTSASGGTDGGAHGQEDSGKAGADNRGL